MAATPATAAAAAPTAGPTIATSSAATGADPQAEFATNDEVKEFCHEGEGENTEHMNSMDLHDIKTELEKEAEVAEVRIVCVVCACVCVCRSKYKVCVLDVYVAVFC